MATDLHDALTGSRERQPARPPLSGQSPCPEPAECRFAHPAEALLGGLLSFYHVRWEYEPTSFVLRRTPAGEIAESFAPDFFLPNHGQYLELTTMRQSHVTRKNGKIRRLRELYPAIQIKTLYRRDYERIIETAGLHAHPVTPGGGSLVFSDNEIAARIGVLANEIVASLPPSFAASEPLLLAAIRQEDRPFQRALGVRLASLGIDAELACLDLTRFDPASPVRRVAAVCDLMTGVRGRAVLLVSGVASTGLSLEFALRQLWQQEPCWLEVASLLDRAAARVVGAPVRFAGFAAPAECLFGFGLSLGLDGDRCDSIYKL